MKQTNKSDGKLSFFKKLIFTENLGKNINLEIFKEDTKVNKVLKLIGMKSSQERETAKTLKMVSKAINRGGSFKSLRKLEEKFTAKGRVEGLIGSNRVDDGGVVVPSKSEELNLLYIELVKKMMEKASRKKQMEYTKKLYDIYYYDFNKYIKNNSSKLNLDILEATDIIREQSEKINSGVHGVNYDALVSSSKSPNDADKESLKAANLENKSYVSYANKHMGENISYSAKTFKSVSFVDEVEYKKWYKSKSNDSQVKNLYTGKTKNVAFLTKVMKEIPNSNELVAGVLVKEYILTLQTCLHPEILKPFRGRLSGNVSGKDLLSVNEDIFRAVFFESELQKEAKELKAHISSMKRERVRLESLLLELAKTGETSSKLEIMKKIETSLSKIGGGISEVYGTKRTEDLNFGFTKQMSIKSGSKKGLQHICYVAGNPKITLQRGVLGDLASLNELVGFMPKLLSDIKNIREVNFNKRVKERFRYKEKEKFSALVAGVNGIKENNTNKNLKKAVNKNYMEQIPEED